ncbi:hypothetical protein PAXRUDRAFT_158406 [Paxillus rubicundulus Ve08.2h10]|uniref:Uncharacterized protein n=1 Tax=Paxillus rubicundulus Ve08.2h10 TaxID=930991 RepID=A0A0D0DGV0_9AGAM|nr:hypothetical protein PAXRUDRAFT_158406 [Paxillus rubicundulus Ve08.2h10]
MDFILALRDASTSDPVTKLSEDALDQLQNPTNIPLIIDSPGIHHSISTYLALEHSSQDAYEWLCCSTTQSFPNALGIKDVQSFYNIEKLICTFTGVEAIHHDMCPNTRLVYTCLLHNLDTCPTCSTSWWNEERLQGSNGHIKVPAQTFTTIPLGPQLQAHNHSPESAQTMCYLHDWTQQILEELHQTGSIPIVDNVAMGWDYLGAVLDGDIKEHDVVLILSLNGTQLYDSKESNCWMYIWVILKPPP